ncbi:TonB-dependent siderophore receptor [Phenylobacterium sp.]|uniref:TonB-dependent receptor plug domain-containing protein n=1 Tax=Phenylobacterium sp. TaxID=1871053 RepID=UPI002737BB00|nr:TonB-dependent receptor [Phenylobacterium sp.]MDP3869381.1 TonB-dependent receptor [Phenylobacterium sp.]
MSTSLRSFLLCSGLVSTVLASPALAQDAVEEVVVTGSRGQTRTVISSPAPIDVISGEQIDKLGGAAPLRDALTMLIPSFQAQTVGSSSWDSLARPAGLRGLGGVHVLVLVDGKRRHNSSLINLNTGNLSNGGNPVDLDLIPSSAIERIEVLRDGAAAQYGSDAIAGVINVILRKATEGGRLNVNAGQRYEYNGVTDGETVQADVYHGFGFGEDGFLTVALDAKTQHDALRGVDTPGQLYFPLPGGAPDPRETTAYRLLYRGGLPKTKSANLSLNAGQTLGGFEVYGSGTLGVREAVVGQGFRRPNSNQNILSIYPDGFAPNYTLDEIDFQATGGLRWTSNGWEMDLSTTYGRNDIDHGSTNTLNASLGPTSPTSFRTFSSQFDQWTTNFDVRREVMVFGDRPLNVAAGAEYRWERYRTQSGDPLSYAAGNYVYPAGYGNLGGRPASVGAQGAVTLTPADEADVSRSNYAAYIDLSLDVTDKLFLAAAGRFEQYDDAAGDVLSGKLSARYEFNDALAVRATVSNGFRAPSLSQQGYAQTANQANIINGVFTFVESKTVRPDSPVGQALGAAPLEPETSTNYSVGLAITPMPGLSVTVDAYRIELRDRIALTGLLSGSGVASILTRNGFPSNLSVRYFANAIDTNTTGVDIVGSYSHQVGDWGRLRYTLGFNWNKTRIADIAANPAELAGLGLTLFDRQQQGAVTLSTPRTKLLLGAEWSHDRWRVNLRESRYGKFDSINNNPTFDQHYGAKWITDLEVGYEVNDRVSVAVGANNIFDVYPDRNTVPDTQGFAPFGGNSPFGIYGGYYYGRVTVNF